MVDTLEDLLENILRGLNLPKKITLKSKKVDKGGGGGRRWIKKAVNVITLTLMAVDKDTGGGGVPGSG